MELDKLYAFAGGKSKEVKKLEKERAKLAHLIEQENQSIASLVKTKGWKLVEQFLENKKNIAVAELKTCSKRKLQGLQSDIKAIDGLFGSLNAKIIAHKNSNK